MSKIFSRKLLSTVAAIIGVVGLIVTLALIQGSLLVDNKELVIVAIAAIAGLGGYNTKLQADLDQNKK